MVNICGIFEMMGFRSFIYYCYSNMQVLFVELILILYYTSLFISIIKILICDKDFLCDKVVFNKML